MPAEATPSTALLQVSRTAHTLQLRTPGLRPNPFVVVPASALACVGAAALLQTYAEDDDAAAVVVLLLALLAAALVAACQVATSALAGARVGVSPDTWHVVQRRRAFFGFWLQQRRTSGRTDDLARAKVRTSPHCAPATPPLRAPPRSARGVRGVTTCGRLRAIAISGTH